MAAKDSPHVAEFRKQVATWTDERFLSRRQLEDLGMFSMYLVNLSEDDGWTYDGHSYKAGVGMNCLTVRATIEGVPYVVFTSGRTYTACVSIFLRKLDQELLEWVPDKFRQ